MSVPELWTLRHHFGMFSELHVNVVRALKAPHNIAEYPAENIGCSRLLTSTAIVLRRGRLRSHLLGLFAFQSLLQLFFHLIHNFELDFHAGIQPLFNLGSEFTLQPFTNILVAGCHLNIHEPQEDVDVSQYLQQKM